MVTRSSAHASRTLPGTAWKRIGTPPGRPERRTELPALDPLRDRFPGYAGGLDHELGHLENRPSWGDDQHNGRLDDSSVAA